MNCPLFQQSKLTLHLFVRSHFLWSAWTHCFMTLPLLSSTIRFTFCTGSFPKGQKQVTISPILNKKNFVWSHMLLYLLLYLLSPFFMTKDLKRVHCLQHSSTIEPTLIELCDYFIGKTHSFCVPLSLSHNQHVHNTSDIKRVGFCSQTVSQHQLRHLQF